MRYNETTPEEYASLWGCDSSYDRAPNEVGDGGHFYNLNLVHRWPTDQQVAFYERFQGAIERTILKVQASPESYTDEDVTADENIHDLGLLHVEVTERLHKAEQRLQVTA